MSIFTKDKRGSSTELPAGDPRKQKTVEAPASWEPTPAQQARSVQHALDVIAADDERTRRSMGAPYPIGNVAQGMRYAQQMTAQAELLRRLDAQIAADGGIPMDDWPRR